MTQTDFAFGWTQLDDLEFCFFTESEAILRVMPVGFFEFGNVGQTLHAFIELHKHTEWCVTRNPATNNIADAVTREELFPDIRLQLFDSKRKAMVIRIDVEDHCLN